ncbi:MAG: hypothetical protein LBE18_04490 [Planctomycetaceae bacterium]|nr:hypothetical protein [Planctomycetaceae bacterium]
MKKNLNDCIVQMIMVMLFTCCLLSFAVLCVHAACSGDDYCGINNARTPTCANAKIYKKDGKLVCVVPDNANAPNCAPKNPPQEQKCDSCLCKSKFRPNNPQIDDICSCQ